MSSRSQPVSGGATDGSGTELAGRHVVVVGAGIAGLTAAHEVAARGVRVTALEAAPQPGGKLRTSDVAGVPVDEGAEAMLARRPEGVDLAGRLELTDQLVHPAGTATARIRSRGRLVPLPAGQVMGVPADLAALARTELLSAGGLLRVPVDLVLPATPRRGDVPVGAYLSARLGREVVDRLVEPLLGGVYAGRVGELSFEATLPAVATAAGRHRSLIAAARAVRAAGAMSGPERGPGAGSGDSGPLFTTLRRGLGTLPGVLADRIAALGGSLRTGATVRELRRTPEGWRLTVGSAHAPERIDADAVIIAVPARPAGRLLAADVPAAAAELARIDYASVAVVTLGYAGPGEFPAGCSGYLVPAVEPGEVKAVTFSTTKWPHLAGPRVVRCSLGRYGDEHVLQRSDADLVAAATAELARTCGITETPVDTRVTRWGGGLPQYTVGHRDRVARIRTALTRHPGLAVCGAAYDGLGIPACVATARAAAARVLDYLGVTGNSMAGEMTARSGNGEWTHGRE